MPKPLQMTPEPLLRPQMPELDTLRGIAVSLVVLFHGFGFAYGLRGLSGVPKIFVALTMPGWVGVNLFFVLSGFLITGILLDTKSRPDYYRRFYKRRALRILPLYYAVLVLLFLLARTGLIERHASWPFLGLSAIYLANVTNLFGVPMQYGVLWSLAVEEHFYLLWPAVVRSLSRRMVIAVATAIASVCLLLRTLYAVLGIAGGGYTWLCADGLAMGAVLAAVARTPLQPRMRVKQFSALAFAISISLLVAGAPFGIFMARRLLGVTLRETAIDVFFAGVLSSTLLLGTSRWKRAVTLFPLQFLGKISYGIYLTHMLLFEVVGHFMQRFWPRMYPAAGNFAVMAVQFSVAVTLTLALTYISRWYFEEGFLRLKNRGEVRSLSVQLHSDEAEAIAV